MERGKRATPTFTLPVDPTLPGNKYNKDLHHLPIDAANRTPVASPQPPLIPACLVADYGQNHMPTIPNVQDLEPVESLYNFNSKNSSKNVSLDNLHQSISDFQ